MAPRSKDGNTLHDRRNKFLRERAESAIRNEHRKLDFNLLVAKANSIAEERQMRWYKNNKDNGRSVRNWLEGNSQLYSWALDVIEYAVIEIETVKREAGSYGRQERERQRVQDLSEPFRDTRIEPAEAKTISSGTRGELDALRNIVTEFVPLKNEARSRILRYLESL